MVVCDVEEIVLGLCGTSFSSLILYSGAALVLSILLLSLFYLWGIFFRDPRMSIYVKLELYEVVLSALLVILIVAFISALVAMPFSTLFPSFLYPSNGGFSDELKVDVNGDSIYSAGYKYYLRVEEDMRSWISSLYVVATYVDQKSSVTVYSRAGGLGLVTSAVAGSFVPIKQTVYNGAVVLSIAYMTIVAQKLIYLFSLQLFLNYYLPLGLLLRSFTPTRTLGGALIGLTLTFAVIMPFLNALFLGILYSDEGLLFNFRNTIEFLFSDRGYLGLEIKDYFETNFDEDSGLLINLIALAGGGIVDLLKNVLGFVPEAILLSLLSILSVAFITSVVIPLFYLTFLIYSASSLSQYFGEKIDITSITRVI